MKPMVLMFCVALATVATCASAAEPQGAPNRDKALMLYFTKSFGSSQRQNRTPLAFGLRLQQASPFDAQRSVSLLDMRYSLGGRKSLLGGGVLMLDSTSMEGSSTTESFSEPWFWVLGGGAALAIACAFHFGVCEESNRSGTDTSTDTAGRSD